MLTEILVYLALISKVTVSLPLCFLLGVILVKHQYLKSLKMKANVFSLSLKLVTQQILKQNLK